MDFSEFKWINEPKEYEVDGDVLRVKTEPVTDFWQRTYYDFRHDNAHAFVRPFEEKEFSFFVKTKFEANKLFDQCGIVIYEDEDNWAKASCEYEKPGLSNLGSVVTNLGYSDWSAHPVSDENHTLWYRVSRRGQDFEFRTSFDGVNYDFMRIFHMHRPIGAVHLGIYCCTPLINSINCEFSEMKLTECQWELYENPDEK